MTRSGRSHDASSPQHRGKPAVQPLLEGAPCALSRRSATPRSSRLALRCLAGDQQLAQHVKIATQYPQPHVPAVAPERPVPAPLQAVARLQRADRRLDPRMTTPRTSEFHGRLTLLTLGLDMALDRQARLPHQLGQLALVLGAVEPAIERRTADPAAQPFLHLSHLLHHDVAVLGPVRQDRVVAHETGPILDDQRAVAELDRLGHLATHDQLRLWLEQAKELLVVGDRLSGEHAATGLVTDVNRHAHEVEQLRPEPLGRPTRRAGTNGDPRRIEQLRSPCEDPVGRVEQGPVGVLEPLAIVMPLARGDPVDGAELRLQATEQVLVLPPAAPAQQARPASGRRDDRAEAVADEARIGGVVDVGGDDERVAPDYLGGLGDEAMPSRTIAWLSRSIVSGDSRAMLSRRHRQSNDGSSHQPSMPMIRRSERCSSARF
jgi:hypothetical protein